VGLQAASFALGSQVGEGMDRSAALMVLVEGSIFHATTPNGASCICLVTSVANGQIGARRITTQKQLAFNRTTGIAKIGDGSVVHNRLYRAIADRHS
jgi:hypothetical protein